MIDILCTYDIIYGNIKFIYVVKSAANIEYSKLGDLCHG